MGTQISKSAGLLDQLAARRELQMEQRRKFADIVKGQLDKAQATEAALQKELEKPQEIAGAREIDRFEKQQQERDNINKGEAVLKAYGLDDPAKLRAINRARKEALAEERQAAIARQDATKINAIEDRKAADAAKVQMLADIREEIVAAEEAKFDPRALTAAQEKVRAEKLKKSVALEKAANQEEAKKLAELELKKVEQDQRMITDIELDLQKISARTEASDEQKIKDSLARDNARDVSNRRLINQRLQAAKRQAVEVDQSRPDETTDGAFEEASSIPKGEPKTTLGLVAEAEPSEGRTARELEEFESTNQAIDLEEQGFELQQRLDASSALINDVEGKKVRLDESIRQMNAEAKREVLEARQSQVDVAGKAALKTPEEAFQLAEDTVQVVVEDPERALQAQAIMSMEAALRVLRD